MPSSRPYDPRSILQVLLEHRVDFVLIGGLAAISHGSPFPTEDVDVTPERSGPNLERLSGTEGYTDLVTDAVETEILGLGVPIASLADIIRSKQAADRPKDRRVLPTLRELLDRRRT